MQVTTLSLNPAIDQTVLCSPFQTGVVNRGQALLVEAGGKGVNVATFLAVSGCPAAATGFLGQGNAAIFEAWFTRHGIADHFIRLPGDTRVGIKIVDLAGSVTTDINLPGLVPDDAAVGQLLARLPELASHSDYFVLTGSLPPGLPVDFYARLVHLLREQGCPVALDTSGAALRSGAAAGPAILKPNLAELADLTGRSFAPGDLEGITGAARGLFCAGVELVVVSMGADGALFIEAGQVLHALPPSIQVRSTVGAGDALLAGLLRARLDGLDLAGCARRAVAFSAAIVASDHRALPPPAEIAALERKVKIN